MSSAEYKRNYYAKNSEKIKIQNDAWRERNKEKVLKAAKTYRDRNKERIKAWQENNRQLLRQKNIERHSEYKYKVLSHYSGSDQPTCKQCGFSDIRALQIDHIYNNGNVERKNIKSSSLYLSIIKNNYPEGYQVLCANCNWIKEIDRRNNARL